VKKLYFQAQQLVALLPGQTYYIKTIGANWHTIFNNLAVAEQMVQLLN
jgi:hypothetical protein